MYEDGWFSKVSFSFTVSFLREGEDCPFSRSYFLHDCHAVVIILQNSHQTALQMMVFKQSSSFNLMF